MSKDILVIDDEADICDLVAEILTDEGHQTRTAYSYEQAVDEIAKKLPDVFIIDIWLENSKKDGVALLDDIKQHHPDLPVIMISGHGNIETAVNTIHKGAYDFIEKPFKPERLLLTVGNAISINNLKKENQELKLRGSDSWEMIGNSIAINQLKIAIDKVAPTGSRVMVTGAAGTGKELVARMIHQKSKRADKPFIVLNAANMTPDRIESELFGIENMGMYGISSGVTAYNSYDSISSNQPQKYSDIPGKIGIFEQADGGTLFIDEVADMPYETQGKILRLLQDQQFSRIGSDRVINVDIRVIAATNRDLESLIQRKLFRKELYYRLNVVPLHIPPLKERREDIPLLCQYFMDKTAKASNLSKKRFNKDALALLQSYDWPGNVRQLRNIMEWLLIMTNDEDEQIIRADMLPKEFSQSNNSSLFQEEMGSNLLSLPLRDARELFEKHYLAAQISRFSGNVSRAANFIGMERSALHRKLKNLRIHNEERA